MSLPAIRVERVYPLTMSEMSGARERPIDRPRVLVVGGGYAGVAAALALVRGRRRAEVILVDRRPWHELTVRLPDVLAGEVHPSRAMIPHADIFGRSVRVLQREITGLDPGRRRIHTTTGDLDGDWLVIALGSYPTFDTAGAREYCRVLKTVADAERLHEELFTPRDKSRRIVIAGSGYTATEVAGKLASRRGPGKTEITVVAGAGRLMPQGNERMAREAERILREKGVHLRLGESIDLVDPESITLRSGLTLPADLVLWAAPSETAPAAMGAGWRLGIAGRVEVDPYLRAVGYERVYVAGDAALAFDFVRGEPAPTNAQLAVQAGMRAGANMLAELSGSHLFEFRPAMAGEAIALGGRDGAAEVLGTLLRGRAALAVKETALTRYLFRLGGLRMIRHYR